MAGFLIRENTFVRMRSSVFDLLVQELEFVLPQDSSLLVKLKYALLIQVNFLDCSELTESEVEEFKVSVSIVAENYRQGKAAVTTVPHENRPIFAEKFFELLHELNNTN
jgi:hypothetical protein